MNQVPEGVSGFVSPRPLHDNTTGEATFETVNIDDIRGTRFQLDAEVGTTAVI